MATKTVELSNGTTVTLTLENFTRGDWLDLVKAKRDEYDAHLAKLCKGVTADDLRALNWADWHAIDTAAGDLLRNPVSADPS